MKFTDLLKRTSTLTVTYRDQPVNLIIFTEKLTPTYREKLSKMSEENKDHDVEVQIIADLIQSWDVLGDDDQPIQATYEFLQLCPYAFLTEIGQAILGHIADVNPQKTSPST
jgi:hypothetical protein